jgi:hypothetical protein
MNNHAPERHFLDWDAPFLPEAAAFLAEHYVGDDGVEMGDAAVVVPTRRAGRRLKELLLAEAERLDCRLVPPRVVTVKALPELLYETDLPLAGDAIRRRAWVSALRGLPPSRSSVLIASPPDPGDVLAWTRLARAIEGLQWEVGGGGLRFIDVIERCADGLLYSDTDRWEVLAEVQDAYERALRSFGFADPDLERIGALQSRALAMSGDLWLAGVAEMPRVVSEMVLRLASSGAAVRALIHAPAAEAAGFDPAGAVIPAAWGERPITIGTEQLAVRGGPADQADEVVRALGRLDGRHAPDEIVIGMPDGELLPYLDQRLTDAEVPMRPATGSPINRSRPYRLLSALAEYADGRHYHALAVLVRHPDIGRWLTRREGAPIPSAAGAPRDASQWIAALDEYFGNSLPSHLDASAIPRVREYAAPIIDLCRRLEGDALLGRLNGHRRIADWMGPTMSLLLEVYGDAELERTISEERELAEALDAIRKAALDLHRLPPRADETVDAATAIRLLLDLVGTAAIPPASDDAAVELLGWLEMHLDDSPVAIVTGLNGEFIPEAINSDAFLPNALRTRLGIIDNAGRYARDAYQLTAMLRSKRHLRLIAGRRTAQGDPLRPSRLMLAVEGPALAERVRAFYGESNDDSRPAITAITGGIDDTESRFMAPPEPEVRTPAPITRVSVSAFGAFLRDPYLYALERQLGLREAGDSARELDGLLFGDVAHKVLERFARSTAIASDDEALARAALDEALADIVALRFGNEALPAIRLQVEQLRARLHAFARWQTEWVAAGWQVVGTECQTPREGVDFQVDGEPFFVTGRIDRIDHHPQTGRWAVFDYKTGDSARDPEKSHRKGRAAAREWKDLQLPLYRHLLPHVTDSRGQSPVPPGAGGEILLGYILLPRELDRVGHSFADWSSVDLDDADECARSVIRSLRDGRFQYSRPSSAIVSGPMANLVGRGYLAGEADDDDGEEAADDE